MKNIKTWASGFALAALAALATGCAQPPFTHPLDKVTPDIRTLSGSSIGLGVQDKREYVVSKERPATFVGFSRFNFGIPKGISTTSGKPLADDFTQVIKTALVSKGTKVTTVELPVGTEEAAALTRVAAAGGQKSLVLWINEWQSGGYMNTGIAYDMQAMVVDSGGKVVATKRLAGNDNLGSVPAGEAQHARTVVPIALRKKIEELFAAPEIASNL
jgi:hypothetical protein